MITSQKAKFKDLFPDQISKIERVLSSYKVDISILDEESLKSIFDEVKVLTLFK